MSGLDKIRDIDKYIEVVKQNSDFFKNYYFHSLLDLNLIKLDSILKHGILSKKEIEDKKLISLYTHDSNDFDSKNGSNYISLSEYTDNTSFNLLFESFAFHTLTSVSLLVDKNINITNHGERETYFDDELFCPNSIDKSNIHGIILPEHLSNLPISQVKCLSSDLSCYTKRYINHFLSSLEKYFEEKISSDDIEKVKNSYEQLWGIIYDYGTPEKTYYLALKKQKEINVKDLEEILASILEKFWSNKLEIKNPNYIDVLLKINNELLPVYEIKPKCLKRII